MTGLGNADAAAWATAARAAAAVADRGYNAAINADAISIIGGHQLRLSRLRGAIGIRRRGFLVIASRSRDAQRHDERTTQRQRCQNLPHVRLRGIRPPTGGDVSAIADARKQKRRSPKHSAQSRRPGISATFRSRGTARLRDLACPAYDSRDACVSISPMRPPNGTDRSPCARALSARLIACLFSRIAQLEGTIPDNCEPVGPGCTVEARA